MELVTASDLFVTASLAVLLSLLVAKLVSMAMATDPNTHNTHHQQPVITLQQERLTVQKPQSKSRVEFLSPIQLSTNVEPEQNREENREEEEETKVESNVVELKVTPENIAAEVELSNVGVLREEHVAEKQEEEEEEVAEINHESEQLGPQAVEDCKEQRKTESGENWEEQRKTECVEDCKEQRKTGCMEDCEEQMGTECVEDCEEQRKIECLKDCEEQGKTEYVEDCEEQRKTEEITAKPFNDDDDDWEGIERSELEKVFMSATEFVGGEACGGLGSDVQMEMYGLHKIATEGPCREPQPMPLKLSARAKWNAWQKLGNMSPEVAMEQYISLLSEKVPGWMKDTSAGMSEQEPKGSEVSESAAPDLSTSLSHQQMVTTERELEQESGAQDHSTLAETDLGNNVKK